MPQNADIDEYNGQFSTFIWISTPKVGIIELIYILTDFLSLLCCSGLVYSKKYSSFFAVENFSKFTKPCIVV